TACELNLKVWARYKGTVLLPPNPMQPAIQPHSRMQLRPLYWHRRPPVDFQVPCECGKSLFVTEGMAGSSVRCRCGRAVMLPSLREMKSRYAAVPDVHLPEPEAHSAAPIVLGVFISLLYGVPALVGALALLAAGLPLACFGFLVAAIGQIW